MITQRAEEMRRDYLFSCFPMDLPTQTGGYISAEQDTKIWVEKENRFQVRINSTENVEHVVVDSAGNWVGRKSNYKLYPKKQEYDATNERVILEFTNGLTL
eukprot:Phypoly_transcript_11650.p3 GENE.Phypoly_transcript_11650~~Phypoly_transcript_11650.p3  ORF type:complete len:101 (-),score=10.05 Phypoly_transcript_11650:370-672(-)